MKYAVLTETLCDGWVNCWTTGEEPTTFNTEAEAQAEIDDCIEGMKESHAEAVEAGIHDADEVFIEEFEREQMRIVEVTA